MRYDGQIKTYPNLVYFIQQNFEIIAVCPEVEIGLSVPRPAIQLRGNINNIKLIGRDDPNINVTDDMQNFCNRKPSQLNLIQAYIFKSKSPSCGVKNIPLFNEQGKMTDTTRGVFVSAMLQHYPNLPITDEQSLSNDDQCENFLQQVKHYQQKLIC